MTKATKVCASCRIEKSVDDFYQTKPSRSRPDGTYANCKKCHCLQCKASKERRREREESTEMPAEVDLAEVAAAEVATPVDEPFELPELVPEPGYRAPNLQSLGLRWVCGTGSEPPHDRTVRDETE